MMLFDHIPVDCDQINNEYISAAELQVYIARFDKVHPVISGNKIYKLRYFLQQAMKEKRPVVTFGGPFSNHLSATAHACRLLNLSCTGIVNGEHHPYTATLAQCEHDGMHIQYVSPTAYREMKTETALRTFPGAVVIPEGGYHPLGAKGAAFMVKALPELTATHICISVGTATTLAGVLSGWEKTVIAVPAIRNMTDIPERLSYLKTTYKEEQLTVWGDYHFGGFAKSDPGLIQFMEGFRRDHSIELDRVYTAKMMFGVFDKIKKGFFAPGSIIICIHTGGLQGNK